MDDSGLLQDQHTTAQLHPTPTQCLQGHHRERELRSSRTVFPFSRLAHTSQVINNSDFHFSNLDDRIILFAQLGQDPPHGRYPTILTSDTGITAPYLTDTLGGRPLPSRLARRHFHNFNSNPLIHPLKVYSRILSGGPLRGHGSRTPDLMDGSLSFKISKTTETP